MAKSKTDKPGKLSDEDYQSLLTGLQVELVKLQRAWIERGEKVLIIFEGRDAAGKDGALKAITAHMSPRQTRVIALPKPSDRDRTSWYFQRYVAHLPAGGECVFFNRSWYNRAGVEPVMGFCTPSEHAAFLDTVPEFEGLLVHSGVRLHKYYFDISRSEQKERLEARRKDPLDFWKVGPIDAAAIEKWDDYTARRDEMFTRTSSSEAPWTVVRADSKKRARLAVLGDILARHDFPHKDKDLAKPDPEILFTFAPEALKDARLAR